MLRQSRELLTVALPMNLRPHDSLGNTGLPLVALGSFSAQGSIGGPPRGHLPQRLHSKLFVVHSLNHAEEPWVFVAQFDPRTTDRVTPISTLNPYDRVTDLYAVVTNAVLAPFDGSPPFSEERFDGTVNRLLVFDLRQH